ncbi:MAG TPA: MobA/MobL family protein [Rhodospirillaceae bacterium]|nr:MobA/MobL family protein [Rhodospirillaceae bacterium]
MAIYDLHASAVKRSLGQSSVAASAYRSRSDLVDERTGERHRYSAHADERLAGGLVGWSGDAASLWNAAEAAEKRKDAMVARSMRLALPAELDKGEQAALAECFAGWLADRHGVAVQWDVHKAAETGDQRNVHAHLLWTTRKSDGASLGAKTRELDVKATSSEHVSAWRLEWEQLQNKALELSGSSARVDRRSHAEKWADEGLEGQAPEPMVHLGPAATAMERRGEASDRGDINRRLEAELAARFAREEAGRAAAKRRAMAVRKAAEAKAAAVLAKEALAKAAAAKAAAKPRAPVQAPVQAGLPARNESPKPMGRPLVAGKDSAATGQRKTPYRPPEPSQRLPEAYAGIFPSPPGVARQAERTKIEGGEVRTRPKPAARAAAAVRPRPEATAPRSAPPAPPSNRTAHEEGSRGFGTAEATGWGLREARGLMTRILSALEHLRKRRLVTRETRLYWQTIARMRAAHGVGDDDRQLRLAAEAARLRRRSFATMAAKYPDVRERFLVIREAEATLPQRLREAILEFGQRKHELPSLERLIPRQAKQPLPPIGVWLAQQAARRAKTTASGAAGLAVRAGQAGIYKGSRIVRDRIADAVREIDPDAPVRRGRGRDGPEL